MKGKQKQEVDGWMMQSGVEVLANKAEVGMNASNYST